VYVDRGAAQLRSVAGMWPRRRVREAARVARTQLSDMVREAGRGAKSGRRRLHVLLGSSLCRFLLLENTRRLKGDSEVLALAASFLKERLGLDPAEWTCSVDRDWDRTALVCAVRSALLDELRASALEADAELRSVRPWIGELLRARNGQASKVRMLGVIEPDAVSLLSDRSGSTQVQALPLNDGGDPLDALRYLAESAGAAVRSLSIVQFDPVAAQRGAVRVSGDFSDCAVPKPNPL
jgi:hypothetical protein